MNQQPPQYTNPQQYQQMPPQFQPFLPQKQSMKYLALWMFIGSWVIGIVGAFFTATFIGAIVGIPMLLAAFIMHILGFIFLAQIKEA
jgi:hypothetical protein